MKKWVWLSVALTISIVAFGCKKSPPPPAESDTPSTSQSADDQQATSEQTPVESDAQPVAQQETAQEEKLVPIPLTLPKPMFVGTPQNREGVQNLEKPLGKPRPPFLAPEGVTNVALHKPVTSSEPFPIMGELSMIVDGDKEATEGSVVELGPFAQWVMIDLEQEYDIYAIVVWHYHRTPSVYKNVVVEISSDPEFVDSTIVFNNDHNNSLGLGVGTDLNYVETAEGKLIDCKGVRGRYVRLWSEGNNQNDYNHYIEVEVYGK